MAWGVAGFVVKWRGIIIRSWSWAMKGSQRIVGGHSFPSPAQTEKYLSKACAWQAHVRPATASSSRAAAAAAAGLQAQRPSGLQRFRARAPGPQGCSECGGLGTRKGIRASGSRLRARLASGTPGSQGSGLGAPASRICSESCSSASGSGLGAAGPVRGLPPCVMASTWSAGCERCSPHSRHARCCGRLDWSDTAAGSSVRLLARRWPAPRLFAAAVPSRLGACFRGPLPELAPERGSRTAQQSRQAPRVLDSSRCHAGHSFPQPCFESLRAISGGGTCIGSTCSDASLR